MDPGVVIGVVLGIPAVGFATRMVIRAVADGIVRVKGGDRTQLQPDHDQRDERLAQLEAEVASLRDEVGRLSAVESFYAQLQGPRAPGPQLPPTRAPGMSS